MSYKKIAYRKTKNGYEKISRNFISSMNILDQKIYRDTNKPFYLVPSDDGPKLTYNTANRTFSFYPQYIGKFYGNNEESATHKYCIEELSKLKKLKINTKNGKQEKIINFSFNYILPEIILPIGKNWIKPDLLIYLREPYDLALKWNRILAVEIVVSHDLNGEKLKLMKDNKITVLKIKANKKWGMEKEENMSEQKKEELKNWIKNSFKKGYTADILLDSKSKAYLENKVINKLETESSCLTKEIENKNEYITQLEEENLKINKLANSEKNNNIYRANIDNKKIGNLELKLKKLSDSNLLLKKRSTYLRIALLGIIFIASLIIYIK